MPRRASCGASAHKFSSGSYTEGRLAGKAAVQYVLDNTAAVLAAEEAYFGTPYPFDKLDFVLLPAFQFSGMEHAGAIYYNAPALFLDHRIPQQPIWVLVYGSLYVFVVIMPPSPVTVGRNRSRMPYSRYSMEIDVEPSPNSEVGIGTSPPARTSPARATRRPAAWWRPLGSPASCWASHSRTSSPTSSPA